MGRLVVDGGLHFCTVVFYLLGAAVLGRLGLLPEKQDLIRTLSVMYTPVFGGYAVGVFLMGAVAVLFSTFFISNATKCRLYTDFATISGLVKLDDAQREKWVRVLGCAAVDLCFGVCGLAKPGEVGGDFRHVPKFVVSAARVCSVVVAL